MTIELATDSPGAALSQFERMQIEREVERLCMRYAIAVNTSDLDAFVDLFCPDAVWQRPGVPALNGQAEIRAFMAQRPTGRTLRHVNGGCLVTVHGADAASAQSQTIVYEIRGYTDLPAPLDGPDLIVEYADQVRRVDGAWRLARRDTTVTFARSAGSAGSGFRAEDRMKIADVLSRYCRAIDRLDMALLATVFMPDAAIDKGAGGCPVAAFIADVAHRHAGVPRTSHMVTNQQIDFLGANRAFVESWCLAVEEHLPVDGQRPSIDHVHRVRYGDLFVRHEGNWRIASRTYVTDHVMSAPVRADLLPASDGRHQGVRGPGDPITMLRNAAMAGDT